MMNKVILIGNLGSDPEIKYVQDGETAIAKFSLATSEKWRDKYTGEMHERTEWHRITAFGRLAEICKEYLFKGKQVYIEGRIQTSSYEKEGIKIYNTETIASTMKMLGSRNSKGDNSQAKTLETSSETSSENSSKTSSETSEDPGESEPEPEKDEIPF